MKASFVKPLSTFLIIDLLFPFVMILSIYFNDEHLFKAYKINYVIANDMLSSEFKT